MGHLGVDGDLLGAYLARVAEHVPVEQAYLVGSRARGEELVDSDYDLVVVSKGFGNQRWISRIEWLMALWEGDVDLHVLPFTPAELEQRRHEIGTVAEAMRSPIELMAS